MASDNTVNVEITASVDGLRSGLKQAESGIKGFSNEADKSVKATNKMAGAVKSNAVPSLTSFSQVIQDAPYGIQGVANNITQLTSQFGYLSKSTGGAGNALKAMASSLAGPAGILLAVSVVTSLLVSYGDEISNIGDETASLVKKNEELVTSFGTVKTLLEAQIGTLDAQLSILEKQGVSTEELLAQKLKLLETELLTLTQQKQALSLQIANTEQAGMQLSLTQKMLNLLSVARGGVITEFAGLDRGEIDKINELKTALADTETTIYKTIEAIGKIKTPDIFDPKKTKKVKPEVIARPIVTAMAGATPIVNEAADGYFESVANKLGIGIGLAKNTLEPLTTGFSESLANMFPPIGVVDEQAAALLASLTKFNEASRVIIESGIESTFSGIGEGIGDALVNGGNVLQAAGSALLSGLGGIMVDLGKQAIAAGITIEAVKKALTSLSGVGAIAAGVALVAIGSAFKSSSSKLGNSMGSSGGASSSTSSSSYGSSTSYSGSGSGGGTYVFEIQGTKLIGVLKNTLDRNKSLGGSTNLIFS